MNKLITTDIGGFPFVLDDIRFESDATIDAFKGMLSSWGLAEDESYILSGAAITDGGANWNVAEGYISIEGEVLFIPAHSVIKAGGGQATYWVINKSFDPAGLKTFEAGGSFNTYQTRVAELITSGTIPALYTDLNAKTITEAISEKVADTLGVYETIDLNGTAALNGNAASDGTGAVVNVTGFAKPNSFLKTNIIGKKIELNFNILDFGLGPFNTTGAYGSMVFTMPNGEIFATGLEQYGYFTAECISNVKAVQGTFRLKTIPGTSKLVCKITLPQGARAAWNVQYELGIAPTKNYTADGVENQFFSWNVSGQATLELA